RVMASWSVCDVESTLCGACGRLIAIDEPIQLWTARELVRCQGCARGAIDDDAVEAARSRVRDRRDRRVSRGPETGRAFTRLSDMKRPFDPKLAALGRDDQ